MAGNPGRKGDGLVVRKLPTPGRCAALALMLAAGAASGQPAQPVPIPEFVGERRVPAGSPFVEAVIAGQPVRLRLDFGANAPVTLSPAAAERLRLAADLREPDGRVADGAPPKGRAAKGMTRPERGIVVSQVGRKTVRVSWSREMVTIDGRLQSLLVSTPASYGVPGADGSIAANALPYAVVRLEQRKATPNDVERLAPVLKNSPFAGLRFRADAGGQALSVQLAPFATSSVGTAATGSALAGVSGGTLSGPVSDVPIVYGVLRPARRLVLAQPWTGAGVPVRQIMMRVADWEGKKAEPPDGDVDADLIQVKARRNNQRGLHLLALGADALGGCADFEWRRTDNMLVMRCPALKP